MMAEVSGTHATTTLNPPEIFKLFMSLNFLISTTFLSYQDQINIVLKMLECSFLKSFAKLKKTKQEKHREVLLATLGVNSCQMLNGFLKQNPIWI